MTIISTPAIGELVIIGVIVAYWCLLIVTGISILKRVDISLSSRLLWIIILLIAPIIGLVLYNFFGRPTANVKST